MLHNKDETLSDSMNILSVLQGIINVTSIVEVRSGILLLLHSCRIFNFSLLDMEILMFF